MAKFYSNENFPIPAVEALRRLGHDVVTIQEQGKANEATEDEAVLAEATKSQRIVLTLNRKDFYRLHDKHKDNGHAGIVVCVANTDFEELANHIHLAIQNAGEMNSKIIRIPPRS